MVTDLVCISCGRTYAPGQAAYTCPTCGLDGILDIQYDYETASRLLTRERLAANPDRSHWRYLPLLPVSPDAARPLLPVGGTPVHEAVPLPRYFGLRTASVREVNPMRCISWRPL